MSAALHRSICVMLSILSRLDSPTVSQPATELLEFRRTDLYDRYHVEELQQLFHHVKKQPFCSSLDWWQMFLEIAKCIDQQYENVCRWEQEEVQRDYDRLEELAYEDEQQL